MSLNAKQVKQLKNIIDAATELLKAAGSATAGSSAPRKRRSGKELIAFRKMLKAEVASGESVVDVAKKHNVSTAYIYQLAGIKKAMTAAKKGAAKPASAKTASAKPVNSKAASAKKSSARKAVVKKTASKKAVKKRVPASAPASAESSKETAGQAG
jgi:DNA-binding protein HU-beta